MQLMFSRSRLYVTAISRLGIMTGLLLVGDCRMARVAPTFRSNTDWIDSAAAVVPYGALTQVLNTVEVRAV